MADRPHGFFEGTEMPTAGWWEALWPDPSGVLERVGLRPGMDAVDLCAGDGWFTLPMTKLARHVTAIDIDPSLLDVSRRRLAETGVHNCDFAHGDAYDIGRLAKPADFVLLANVFHGVPDRPRLAAAVRGVLKPNGRFAIINWQKRPRDDTIVRGEPRGPKTELRMSPDETVAAAEAGGLKCIAIVELPPWHYGATFERAAT